MSRDGGGGWVLLLLLGLVVALMLAYVLVWSVP